MELGDGDAAYKRRFSPEFRNRLDAKIDFAPLSREVMGSIVQKLVGELETQLAERKVSFVLTEDAIDYLAKEGYDPAYGARPLARVIRDKLSEPLSEEILYGQLEGGGRVTISVARGASGEVEGLSFEFE